MPAALLKQTFKATQWRAWALCPAGDLLMDRELLFSIRTLFIDGDSGGVALEPPHDGIVLVMLARLGEVEGEVDAARLLATESAVDDQ